MEDGEHILMRIFIIISIKIQEVNYLVMFLGQPMWSTFSFAGFLGGFTSGFITNPIDIVYNRQAADALLPNHLKRNYLYKI